MYIFLQTYKIIKQKTKTEQNKTKNEKKKE